MKELSMENACEIFDECEKAAIKIQNPEIAQNIREAREALEHSHNLRIAFVASDIKDVLQAADSILHVKPSLSLVKSFDVVNSCRIDYSYANEDVDGDFSKLKKDVSSEQSQDESSTQSPEKPVVIHCTRTGKALDGVDVSMFCSLHGFADFNWRKEFEKMDFVFLLTNATYMLNAVERKFADSCIRRYFGFERLAIVVTNMDYIQDIESYKELKERLNNYAASLDESVKVFIQGEDDISEFIRTEIVESRETLLNLYTYQLTKTCVEEVGEAVSDMLQKADVDADRIEDARKTLEAHKDDLMYYADVTARNAAIEIGDWKYSYLEALRKFSEDMYNEICEGVDTSKDLDKTIEFINKYMRDSRREFHEHQNKILENKAADYERSIEKKMQEDAGTFFSELAVEGVDLRYMWEHIDIEKQFPRNNQVEMGESELKKRVDKISRTLMIASAPLMIFGIPVAAASLAGSQVVKHAYKKEIAQEYKDDIKKQVKEICDAEDSYDTAEAQNWFAKKSEEVKDSVLKRYESFLQTLTTEISNCAEEAKQAADRRQILEKLQSGDIPGWKAQLE